jgi:hypothetical protein
MLSLLLQQVPKVYWGIYHFSFIFLQWAWKLFLSIVRHLPLVSGLPDCNRFQLRDAVKEVFVNFVLSTSPIWLGSLITFGVDTSKAKTFSEYLNVLIKSVSDGAMLIYATAAIAPLFYFSLTRPKSLRDFPGRISHIVCALLIFMICTALYGVQQSGVKIDPNFILPSSVFIYALAISMIYIATVYRNWRDTAEEVIGEAETAPRTQERMFVDQAKEHRDA